jgi:hypothetical protein
MAGTAMCVARVHPNLPKWAPSKDAACGHRALPERSVLVTVDRLVSLELCGIHALQLDSSPDPPRLVAAWAAAAAAEHRLPGRGQVASRGGRIVGGRIFGGRQRSGTEFRAVVAANGGRPLRGSVPRGTAPRRPAV